MVKGVYSLLTGKVDVAHFECLEDHSHEPERHLLLSMIEQARRYKVHALHIA